MKKLFFLGGIFSILMCNTFFPQISITSLNFYYQEDFNSLSSNGTSNTWTDNSTIPGWYSNRSVYRAGTGSSNTGALYSFGADASTERALGSLASGTTNTIFYAVKFVNNTLNTITQIPIQYTGEQWKSSSSTSGQTLYFDYQVNAVDIVTGEWTNVPELNFTGPISSGTSGTLDGNDPSNSETKNYTITVTLNNGEAIWFRFRDEDDSGSDHALGIDDFILDATSDPMPIELNSFYYMTDGSDIILKWKTTTELNNYGFDVERKSGKQNLEWKKIGFVKGNGTSNSPKNYFYKDETPKYGSYQYRLKQIDNDGNYHYSNSVEVNVEHKLNYTVKNYPNPFNPVTKIIFELPIKSFVKLKIYNLVGQEIATLVNEELEPGLYERYFNADKQTYNNTGLPSGIYIYSINAGGKIVSGRMLLMK